MYVSCIIGQLLYKGVAMYKNNNVWELLGLKFLVFESYGVLD